MGFLHLAVSKNREKIIIPVLNDFIDMANNHIRKTTATVVSAVPLREEQVSALANLLSRKLNKQVDIVQRIDPSVIGGIYINVDGYYIDKTIKSRLRGIKESMA
jgi:F-type H+-transporting ATPase subunit delta